MRLLRSHRGQSTAEYAVLFAIVIGAAVAMQQYVKSRLQGAMSHHTNSYLAASTEGKGNAFEPNRTANTTSNQTATLGMQSATVGLSTQNTISNTVSNITKDTK